MRPAISDVHVDYKENMDWLRAIPEHKHQQDVLIVAGDLTDQQSLLREVRLSAGMIVGPGLKLTQQQIRSSVLLPWESRVRSEFQPDGLCQVVGLEPGV